MEDKSKYCIDCGAQNLLILAQPTQQDRPSTNAHVPMKSKSKIMIAVIACVVAVVAIIGIVVAASSPSALIGGVWLPEERPYSGSDLPRKIEFFSDGTCFCDAGYIMTNGRYTIDGKRLKITLSHVALTYDLNVRGNTLSLSLEGETVTYKRER